MAADPRDAAYLYDMIKAAEKVRRYVEGRNFGEYLQDDLLRDGVERNILTVGEAARRLSEQFKQRHPGIPWRKIIAQRNVIVHEYEVIKNEEVWEVATVHLPKLVQALKLLLPPLPPEPAD